MKKSNRYIYSVIILLFILISTSNGQVKFIGGNFGYNLSKLDYKADIQELEFNYRNGIMCGLFIEYKLTNLFSIRSEVNYSMRGVEYKPNKVLGPVNEKYIYKLDYLEIPVFIQYKIIINNNLILPKIFFGPEISYLLSAVNKYINDDFSKVVSEKEKFKSVDYGIILGLGFDFNILMNRLSFDARYNHGLNNINKNSDIKINSHTVSFNLGYAFSIN
ncbi:MAG: porin family protein [Ignavibacteria bacterium]|jgi:hypothetical protein